MHLKFVDPKECLQDEKVLIKIHSLKPYQKVTVTAHAEEFKGRGYYSYAHYIADCNGTIDVGKDHSYGGHYTGVFRMGLISSLLIDPNNEMNLRFHKKDVTKASEIKFCVFDSHLNPTEIFPTKTNPLSFDFHFRIYMAKGVQRIPITIGRVRGILFLPAGEGPFPGVIDLDGSVGGCNEYRAAQLASRGIAALALAIFNYKDLPSYVAVLEMSYFREATHVLLSFDKVSKPKIGVVGVSKGGDLVLSMAVHIPEIALVVSINGSNANRVFPLKISDTEIIPPMLHDTTKLKVRPDNSLDARCTSIPTKDCPETIIPVHKISASILFIVAEDDGALNIVTSNNEIKELLKKHNKTNFKVLSYKGAGHLIAPPYSPLCSCSYYKELDVSIYWGGKLEDHTFAQEDSWPKIINFIKTHLSYQAVSKM